MTEKYIIVSDDEYCYTLDTQAENYKTLEDFEKQEFQNAKKENIDIKEYEDAILEVAYYEYWEWVYDNYLESDTINDIMNTLVEENKQLKIDNKLFFNKVFNILLKYQDLFNREMADEVLEELRIELTEWFE